MIKYSLGKFGQVILLHIAQELIRALCEKLESYNYRNDKSNQIHYKKKHTEESIKTLQCDYI